MQQFLNILQRGKQVLAAVIATFLLLSSVLALPAFATNATEVPDISTSNSTWITDTAEVLSRATESRLNRTLKELAQNTDRPLRLVIFRRLDYGISIDTFADDLFARWYPDTDSSAKQTLLAIDTITNNIAVRTGATAAERLTPEIIGSTVNENIGQELRGGDKYNQAFEAGIDRFAAVLAGDPDPGPPEVVDNVQAESTYLSAEETDTKSSTTWVIVLLVLATAIPMATYYGYVLLTRD
ncbi:MAG: TPM domain-containing protein [Cyanobacteria bacterium J06641_5]